MYIYSAIQCHIDFLFWKDSYESRTDSQFVKATGAKGKTNSKISYYYCNRSGFLLAGARANDAQGRGAQKILMPIVLHL